MLIPDFRPYPVVNGEAAEAPTPGTAAGRRRGAGGGGGGAERGSE